MDALVRVALCAVSGDQLLACVWCGCAVLLKAAPCIRGVYECMRVVHDMLSRVCAVCAHPVQVSNRPG